MSFSSEIPPESTSGRFAMLQEVGEVAFGFFTPEEIGRLSVKRITNGDSYDALNNPVQNGLYDLALGPTEREHGKCPTCGLDSMQCPGHLGHIELCVPVYNPLLFPTLFKLIKMMCPICKHFRMARHEVRVTRVKLLLCEANLYEEASNLDAELNAIGVFGSSKRKAAIDDKMSHMDRVLAKHEAAAQETLNAALLEAEADRAKVGASRKPRVQMHMQSRSLWRSVVKDFMKAQPPVCHSCHVPAHKYRKDGYIKIFRTPMSSGGKGGQTSAPAVHRVEDVVSGLSNEQDGSDNDSDMEMAEVEQKAAAPVVPSTSASESDKNDTNPSGEVYVHPSEVQDQLKALWRAESALCNRIWSRVRGGTNALGYTAFFCQTLAVPPSRFRPPARMADNTFEHTQNTALSSIIKADEKLRMLFAESEVTAGPDDSSSDESSSSDDDSDDDDDSSSDDGEQKRSKKKTSRSNKKKMNKANKNGEASRNEPAKLGGMDEDTLTMALNQWVQLQEAVNGYLDSSKVNTRDPPPGVRQGLEKKEGLFRQNMMGKRVNYAARSVISPDPYIGTDEVGLPVRFARKLSYREPVTSWNVDELSKMVRNGMENYPGAAYLEDENGRMIDLSRRTERQREELAEKMNNLHSMKLAEDAAVRASRARPGTDDGVFLQEQNRAHAPLSLHGQMKVWRHVRSGDIMLANRQPTLHKPSLMAHKVRVINNEAMQTIRLHYANCNSYNADFDGDEINLHLPQSELCRAEAYEVAYTNHQYCSTTDGEPLRGLIQDHVDMGVMLTKQNTFLTREEYTQMLVEACSAMKSRSPEIKLQPPCILKPKAMWSGKQVISTILMHLVGTTDPDQLMTMGPGKTKTPANAWKVYPEPNLEDMSADELRAIELVGDEEGKLGQTQVVFRKGELCTGILDKAQFGASKHGLVHSVYELYGPNAAGELLSSLGRLFTYCAQKWGHTCALEDLVLNRDAEEFRTARIRDSVAKGVELSAEFAGLEDGEAKSNEEVARALERRIRSEGEGDIDEAILDSNMQGVTSAVTSEIIKECLPKGQRKPFPANCFSLMVFTGAKGSLVNHSQVSCALGQQALEGRRVPRTIAGKSLPCFSAFDPTPRAGGFVSDRFLTGVRPQEYYFHCMAGREGLIDTAVKTARSGYLQRCLVKHLENLTIGYDRTVRQADGGVVQFTYGGDGLDALNTSYLHGDDFTLGFLHTNASALLKRLRVGAGAHELNVNAETGDKGINFTEAPTWHKRVKRTLEKASRSASGQVPLFATGEVLARRPRQDTNSEEGVPTTEAAFLPGLHKGQIVKTHKTLSCVDVQFASDKKTFRIPLATERTQMVFGRVPDPVMAELSPDMYLGSVSESLQAKIDGFVASNPDGLLKSSADASQLRKLVYTKYLKSLCSPGENVGVIAAQSIGEPSTQMTLNTFHLAGHGAGNVTLGIPRLRELLMTASKSIKTPSMAMPLRPGLGQKDGEKIRATLYRVKLAELLRANGGIEVREALCRRSGRTGQMAYGAEAAELSRTEQGSGEWYREYTLTMRLQPLGSIAEEFSLDLEEIAAGFGMEFTPKLARAMIREMRRVARTVSKSKAETVKEASMSNNARGRANFGDSDGDARKKTKKKALKKQGSASADESEGNVEEEELDMEETGGRVAVGVGSDDDDEEDEREEEAEAKGAGERGENDTLRLGRKKEMDGYDDVDAEESESDDDSASDSDNSRSSLSSAARGGGRTTETSALGSESDSGASDGEEKPAKRVTVSKNRTKRSAVRGYPVKVPDSMLRHNFFVSCEYSNESKTGKRAARLEVKLRFKAMQKKILLVGIAEEVARESVVRATPGIQASYVVEAKGESKELSIQTDGCNFFEAWALSDKVDVNRIRSNDVGAWLKTYGVEAARAAIVNEVKGVFGVYGIGVDERHLGLVADYMTYEGDYRALNRGGIDSSSSPFVRMTFETSTNFLMAAALEGESDSLASASSRLCLGQLLTTGTGAFDLLVPNKGRA
ncbi:DNA-directed RNA polymerase subunit [Hondaea fermentalgiana]|uniref:DNA-directed RNA polymerase subunit n=1 Tax=Hondaea fermentalgiana TaxID=2315210 RepID=A0A2R5G8Y8_9STRA|nr:DNA-directed RNA polymerase subunit [Hondaea fermentalgiana]|eukprot:GBG27507.1 DNA-directed RNA polymerase subunit [Hondaea fermentalgiana]